MRFDLSHCIAPLCDLIIFLLGLSLRFFLLGLERYDKGGKVPALLHRRLVAGAVFSTAGGESFDYRVAEILVLDLSASESYYDADLVTVLQKPVGVIELGVEVVVSDNDGQLDLFRLRVLLFFAGFLFLFDLVKTEFAVVHDAAYGRIRLRGDEDEVQVLFVRELFRPVRSDDAERLAVFVDKSDGGKVDIVVYQGVIFSRADFSAPPGLFAQKRRVIPVLKTRQKRALLTRRHKGHSR